MRAGNSCANEKQNKRPKAEATSHALRLRVKTKLYLIWNTLLHRSEIPQRGSGSAHRYVPFSNAPCNSDSTLQIKIRQTQHIVFFPILFFCHFQILGKIQVLFFWGS